VSRVIILADECFVRADRRNPLRSDMRTRTECVATRLCSRVHVGARRGPAQLERAVREFAASLKRLGISPERARGLLTECVTDERLRGGGAHRLDLLRERMPHWVSDEY
jgi:hypothetical protein